MTNTHIPEVAIPSVFPSHHKKCGLIANTLFIFQYFYLQFRISFRLPVAALLIFPLYIRQVSLSPFLPDGCYYRKQKRNIIRLVLRFPVLCFLKVIWPLSVRKNPVRRQMSGYRNINYLPNKLSSYDRSEQQRNQKHNGFPDHKFLRQIRQEPSWLQPAWIQKEEENMVDGLIFSCVLSFRKSFNRP